MDTIGEGKAAAQDMAQQAKEKAQNMADRAKTAGTAVWERAKMGYSVAQERAAEGMRATDRAIKENPYRSVGIAFGVGLLLGFLIKRRR